VLLLGVPVTDVDDPHEPRRAVRVQTALEHESSVAVEGL